MASKAVRAKISTTIAAENYDFATNLVASGEAENLSEVVDEALEHFRRRWNRMRLASATASYFDSLSPEAKAQEHKLAQSLHSAANGIDFDREP